MNNEASQKLQKAGGAEREAREHRKAKFQVGQVVRVCQSYFAIERRQYVADRVAIWDNGWWYWKGKSCYSEHAIKELTKRERGA